MPIASSEYSHLSGKVLEGLLVQSQILENVSKTILEVLVNTVALLNLEHKILELGGQFFKFVSSKLFRNLL